LLADLLLYALEYPKCKGRTRPIATPRGSLPGAKGSGSPPLFLTRIETLIGSCLARSVHRVAKTRSGSDGQPTVAQTPVATRMASSRRVFMEPPPLPFMRLPPGERCQTPRR